MDETEKKNNTQEQEERDSLGALVRFDLSSVQSSFIYAVHETTQLHLAAECDQPTGMCLAGQPTVNPQQNWKSGRRCQAG